LYIVVKEFDAEWINLIILQLTFLIPVMVDLIAKFRI